MALVNEDYTGTKYLSNFSSKRRKKTFWKHLTADAPNNGYSLKFCGAFVVLATCNGFFFIELPILIYNSSVIMMRQTTAKDTEKYSIRSIEIFTFLGARPL